MVFSFVVAGRCVWSRRPDSNWRWSGTGRPCFRYTTSANVDGGRARRRVVLPGSGRTIRTFVTCFRGRRLATSRSRKKFLLVPGAGLEPTPAGSRPAILPLEDPGASHPSSCSLRRSRFSNARRPSLAGSIQVPSKMTLLARRLPSVAIRAKNLSVADLFEDPRP